MTPRGTGSVSGRYAIFFAGQPCGEERWTIVRTAAGEVASGEQVTRAPFPFPSTQRWRAGLDAEGRVAALEVDWEVGGRLVRASHAADGPTWRVHIDYAGHVREQEGDYPPGVHVLFGSPLFHTFAFRRFVLAPGAEHEFAALLVGPPYMAVEPGHQKLHCTETREIETALGRVSARRIEVLDPARGPAEALTMWIDEHDIVLEAYEGAGEGTPWMRLVERSASPDGSPGPSGAEAGQAGPF